MQHSRNDYTVIKKIPKYLPMSKDTFYECQLEEPVMTSRSGSSVGRETAQQIIM